MEQLTQPRLTPVTLRRLRAEGFTESEITALYEVAQRADAKRIGGPLDAHNPLPWLYFMRWLREHGKLES